MKKRLLLSSIFAFSSLLSLLAQPVLLTEDFSTLTVGAALNGQNGWSTNSSTSGLGDCSGFGCNRMTVSNTALTATLPYSCASPNSLSFGGDLDSPGKLFSPAATTSFYVGMRVSISNFATVATRGDFIRLYGSSTFSTVARISAIASSGNRFGIQTNSNGGSISTDPLSKPLLTNTTYYLVLKYEFVNGAANDIIKLYINPKGSSEPASADLEVTSANGASVADPTSVKGMAFYGTTTALTNQAAGKVSCIRVATTWGDVVPVEMTHFNALPKGNTNLLTWTTASEKNVAHFNVEKSANGIDNWQAIGTTKTVGNSTAMNTYSFIDDKPLLMSYYRINTIDKDATEHLSPIVSVKQNTTKGAVKLFPQPANDNLTLQVESPITTKATIQVLDASGRLLWTQTADFTEGVNSFQVPTQNLTNGLYLMTVNNGITTFTEKFMKQ
jgi:hypothetical protein